MIKNPFREKAYACPKCGWQGMLDPSQAPLGAPCPECGEVLRPRPWRETWGFAIFIISVALIFLLLAAMAIS